MFVDPLLSFRSLGFLVAGGREWVRELLRFALEAYHAEDIHEAANGWEALRVAAEIMPDVVLIEADLPGVTAPEVTRCLRKSLMHDGPQPAVLVVANRPFRDEVVRARDAGADDVLRLPFCARFLSQRLVRALARRDPQAPTFRLAFSSASTSGYHRPQWPAIGMERTNIPGLPLLTPEEIRALTSQTASAGDGP
ncbi:MAG: response regulator [Rhodospirillales bacterium]|jgi:DNA-binding response OmpR family regulator|nr:response regulator [Rhodospirillales bacterium]